MKKVSFVFDPFELAGVEVPRTKRDQAARAIADFVREEVLDHCGAGKSPVAGGSWKRSLSPEYKKKKLETSGVGFANMELDGDMLDALNVVKTRGGKLSLEVGGSQAGKADGHNNHSGKSKLPAREFIPKKGETFNKSILAGIRAIAMEYTDDGEE